VVPLVILSLSLSLSLYIYTYIHTYIHTRIPPPRTCPHPHCRPPHPAFRRAHRPESLLAFQRHQMFQPTRAASRTVHTCTHTHTHTLINDSTHASGEQCLGGQGVVGGRGAGGEKGERKEQHQPYVGRKSGTPALRATSCANAITSARRPAQPSMHSKAARASTSGSADRDT